MHEVLLPVEIEPLESGGFLATSDELPGLVAEGRTIAETLEIARDVARMLVESYERHGDPMPPGLAALASRGKALVPVMLG
jgi:antitoxin HicB